MRALFWIKQLVGIICRKQLNSIENKCMCYCSMYLFSSSGIIDPKNIEDYISNRDKFTGQSKKLRAAISEAEEYINSLIVSVKNLSICSLYCD